jgi:hypothetical protein
MQGRSMQRRVLALAGLLTVITVACSVVDDGKVQRINPGVLDDTLPTTTESNTTTTEAATTTTGLETTTTGVQAVAVQLYYIAGSQLNSVPDKLTPQFALSQLVTLLQVGLPKGDLGRTLRSALPKDVEITATPDYGAGVAQVVLPDGFFDTIAIGDQRLAVGQLVMTLLDNSPGIGQLMFNQQVSGPGGEVIPAGQLITRLDYQSLLTSATTTFTTLPAETTTSLVG